MAKTKSKPKQEEFEGMPTAPNRELLLTRAELSDRMGSMADELKELDDQIRTAMREEKTKAWSCEDPQGKKYMFKLKTTGERVVMARIKEKKKTDF